MKKIGYYIWLAAVVALAVYGMFFGEAAAKSCNVHCPDECDTCEICEECPDCPDCNLVCKCPDCPDCVCDCTGECPDLKCPNPCGDPCPDVTCPECPDCVCAACPPYPDVQSIEPGTYTGYLLGANSFTESLMWGLTRVDVTDDGVNAAAVIIIYHPVYGSGILTGGGHLERR